MDGLVIGIEAMHAAMSASHGSAQDVTDTSPPLENAGKVDEDEDEDEDDEAGMLRMLAAEAIGGDGDKVEDSGGL